MNKRFDILTGAQAAIGLHQRLGTESELGITRGPVNVFGALQKSNSVLMFRPLEGLLGACIKTPVSGVLISTQRPLPVQRFTGAHELGHVAMEHSTSLDGEEILDGCKSLNSMEIQANAFAAEFLVPRWLLTIHAKAQGWNRDSLRNPDVVYQLSLRLGVSYDATTLALKNHNIVDQSTLSKLRSTQPRAIKMRLLTGYTPVNWHRDVWVLTEKDEGAVIEGQPDDLFLFRLNEKPGAGYLWNTEELKKQHLTIVKDVRIDTEPEDAVGSDVQREVTATVADPKIGEVEIALKRPWQKLGTPAGALHVRYDFRGKERGLPRASRIHLEAA
jgi:Zn-dependent peptidase ImmA (M78 family)/predicted secreted protein